MFGRLGTAVLGATEFLRSAVTGARRVACIGDSATHKGTISVSGQEGTRKTYAGGDEVAVDGAIFNCKDHGPQEITASKVKKTYIFIDDPLLGRIEKKPIVSGDRAACGAVIRPSNRGVNVG